MILEYSKIRPDVEDPSRANPSDAGMDAYYSPANGSDVWIDPSFSERLQTGLKFGIPHGYMLQVMNRSSIAAKRDLVVGAHVVDSGYDGEVFVDLHNIGNMTQVISPGDKIAQVVLVPVIPFRISEVDEEDLYDEYPIALSDRGNGALGSTDDDKGDDDYDDYEDEDEDEDEDWEDEE